MQLDSEVLAARQERLHEFAHKIIPGTGLEIIVSVGPVGVDLVLGRAS